MRVIFKNEGFEGDEAIGPVTVVAVDGDTIIARIGVPYDPTPKPWVTLSEARAVAAEHGVALEEV